MTRGEDAGERTCLVTRTVMSPSGLIRFVRGPDGTVVPDVSEKLPGRGVWVTGRRDIVEQAVRKRLFARGFKADTVADPGLPDLVEGLLADRALRSLSMARKAGRVVTGFGKVTTALGRGGVVAVVHAREAADDGRRKVMQAMMRRARELAEDDDEDMDLDFDDESEDGFDEDDRVAGWVLHAATISAAKPVPPERMPKVIRDLFSVADLDLALGGPNVIHAALLAGGASTSFLNNAAALARYRGGEPETEWMAGYPGSSDPGDPRHDWSSQDQAVASGDADKATGED